MTTVFKKNNCTIVKRKDNYELQIKKINQKFENFLLESLNINNIITEKKCLKTCICKINFSQISCLVMLGVLLLLLNIDTIVFFIKPISEVL